MPMLFSRTNTPTSEAGLFPETGGFQSYAEHYQTSVVLTAVESNGLHVQLIHNTFAVLVCRLIQYM